MVFKLSKVICFILCFHRKLAKYKNAVILAVMLNLNTQKHLRQRVNSIAFLLSPLFLSVALCHSKKSLETAEGKQKDREVK